MEPELQALRRDVDGLKRILEINLEHIKDINERFVRLSDMSTKLAEHITQTNERLGEFADETNGRLDFLELMRE